MGQTLKKTIWPALGLALAIVVAPNSKADNFDTTLANGVYFGSGNSNSNFTTDTSSDHLELGLSVITRYLGPIDPGAGSNTYTVLPGTTSVSGKDGSIWGFVFSVDTDYDNSPGGPTVGAYTYSLTVKDLTSGVTTGPFNPSAIPDNAHNGSTGFQNAEAISFGIYGPPSIFDINAPDLYEIDLTATPTSGAASSEVTVFANATGVPEPSSVVLLFTLAAGVFVLGRRRFAAT